MAFRLIQFDGLEISEYIQRGDTQDLGSGSAMTAFLSLPGGGFYDNFGTKVRPLNIQTPHKKGVLWGTNAELRQQLQAWRAMRGRRGKLTAEWDDGELRWIWAVLQDVSAPRPSEAKGGWLAIDLTWVTATQAWRGPLHGDDAWVWGDGSWTWGDGSAEFGDGADFTFTLADSDETVTITNEGDVDVTFLVLRFDLTGSWADVTISNAATGQEIEIARTATTTHKFLEINTGARTIYAGGSTTPTITSAYREQNRVHFTTSGAHGQTTGGTVRITGTTTYDGDYYPVTSESSTQFYVTVTPDFSGYGTITDGNAQSLTSIYDLLDSLDYVDISDRKRWLTLAPGDNDIRIVWTPYPTTATLEATFYDQYA